MASLQNLPRQNFDLQLRRILVGLLCLVSLLPFWFTRHQPLPDLPNHMAASSIWLHLGDKTSDVSTYYDLNLGLNPYWGYYAPMLLFGKVAGVEVANRIVLSLYALVLIFGFSFLLRRLEKSAWLIVFAFPFIWTFSFTFGFIHTSLGLALVPLALALFDQFSMNDRPLRAALLHTRQAWRFFSATLCLGRYLSRFHSGWRFSNAI